MASSRPALGAPHTHNYLLNSHTRHGRKVEPRIHGGRKVAPRARSNRRRTRFGGHASTRDMAERSGNIRGNEP